jgi:tetratricopeptide (TPR) repeat protein
MVIRSSRTAWKSPSWPYDWQAAEIFLDSKAIREQGEFFLNRGLNIHRMVAFVGAGVSMAYGRISWGELALVQAAGILDSLEPHKEALNERVKPLYVQLHGLRSPIEKEEANAIVLGMQIAEQIWSLVEEKQLESIADQFGLRDRLEDIDISDPANRTRVGRELFRTSIKNETYDETAHVRRIFTNPFEPADAVHNFALKIEHRGALTRYHDQCSDPRLYRLFSKNTLDRVFVSIPGFKRTPNPPRRWRVRRSKKSASPAEIALELAGDLSTLIYGRAVEQPLRRGPGEGLPAYNYHTVGVVLDLLRFAKQGRERVDLNGIGRELRRAFRKPDQEERRRTAAVPRSTDPLWLLMNDLEIRRIVTTNYDLEVERLLDDIGFERTQYAAQEHLKDEEMDRIGPMGGRAHELVLTEENAVDLMDFAASDTPFVIQVAHVHGRATAGEEIVITDRDYQEKYIGSSKGKIITHQGLHVLFGGNPILFVGVSLAEGDVMRPLREFASEHVRRNNSVIALRAATKQETDRNIFTLEHYIRHGLRVVHYGFVTPDNADEVGKSWLHAFEEYAESLLSALTGIERGDDVTKEIENVENKLSAFKVVFGPAPRGDVLATLRDFPSDWDRCDIAFEFEFLRRIAGFITELSKNPKLWNTHDEKMVKCLLGTVLRKAVKRTQGAVLTAALSACLRGIKRNWLVWWPEWASAPRSRLEHLRFSTANDLPGATAVTKGMERLRSTRWFRYSIEESASSLVSDSGRLRSFIRSVPKLTSERRRIFVIPAPRGAGKGSFYSQLAKYGDLMLGCQNDAEHIERCIPAKRYAGHFFVNFSFSSEVASVWDGLCAFLMNPEQEAWQTLSPTEDAVDQPLKGGRSRLERLQRAVDGAGASSERVATAMASICAERIEHRYLVVFQAFDLLLDASGHPKHAEIRAICDLLFKCNAPIDYVLIVRSTQIPLYFRAVAVERMGQSQSYPERALQFLIDHSLGAGEAGRARGIAEMIIDAGLKVVLPATSAIGGLLPESNKSNAAPTSPAGDGAAGKSAAESNAEQDYLFALDQLGREELELELAALHKEFSDELPERIREAYIKPGSLLVGRFRFAIYGLIQRDMAECKFPGAVRANFLLSMSGSESGRGAVPTDRFLERAMEYWSTRPFDTDVDRRTIARAFGYRQDARIGAVKVNESLVKHGADYRLQELLIRHLAVISTPVEADVLLACPAIDERVTELLRREGRRSTDEDGEARRRLAVVEYALALLSGRGLCFTIIGKHETATQAARPPRFQVHRSVWVHIYRKLGSQNIEPADSYFFSVSLFASQTRELPALNANAYAFLHELVNALIAYPHATAKRVKTEPAFTARRLRAALGIVRTLFSIGVVARFAELEKLVVPTPPRPGYFEHHRLTLRWMLREALRLEEEKARQSHGAPSLHVRTEEWNPYYPDEIVWLFNECGVFSLAQGQCYDAVAMFDAALAEARKIEGSGAGPIRRRILINLGACALYRGRPNEARRVFSEVENETSEDATVRAIAKGYLALLDHLGGEHDTALRGYTDAIKSLREHGRSRPVSMFLRHRGDLHRYKGDVAQAERDFDEAIDHARRVGYEDMVQFAVVARVRMRLAEATAGTTTSTALFKELLKLLDGAERYADAMELPYLRADAAFVHAQVLLGQGETGLAAENATRALRIATMCGLVLRSIAYRSLIAEIYIARGWTDEGARMKAQVLQAASNAGYRHLIQSQSGALRAPRATAGGVSAAS